MGVLVVDGGEVELGNVGATCALVVARAVYTAPTMVLIYLFSLVLVLVRHVFAKMVGFYW